MTEDHIYSQHPDTGKWAIGKGIHTYHTRESAAKAYANYLKRGGTPVEVDEVKDYHRSLGL